jgi:hypothetical protein
MLSHRSYSIHSKKTVHHEDQSENNKKYMISFNSPYRLIWDMMIVILALYNAIIVPLEISFKPDFRENPGYEFVDYFVDFIFLIDILINFRTTTVNKYGEVIEDPKLIAKHYIFSLTFLCDILCICEIHMIWGSDSALKIL